MARKDSWIFSLRHPGTSASCSCPVMIFPRSYIIIQKLLLRLSLLLSTIYAHCDNTACSALLCLFVCVCNWLLYQYSTSSSTFFWNMSSLFSLQVHIFSHSCGSGGVNGREATFETRFRKDTTRLSLLSFRAFSINHTYHTRPREKKLCSVTFTTTMW